MHIILCMQKTSLCACCLHARHSAHNFSSPVCMYIFMCMCTCICVCVCAYICVHMYGYCVYVCICVYMLIYIYVCICVCVYMCMCVYVYISVCIYIYIHIYIYIYICINYSMSHGHQEGVCLQRQSSAEKSSENIFLHKFLSVFKLYHEYSISEATENHFIRQGQK